LRIVDDDSGFVVVVVVVVVVVGVDIDNDDDGGRGGGLRIVGFVVVCKTTAGGCLLSDKCEALTKGFVGAGKDGFLER